MYKKFIFYALGLLVIGAISRAGYVFLHRNPLPLDEELIAHFKTHKYEFEELVRRYREYKPESPGKHYLWKNQGETPKLYKEAGVKYFSTAIGYWIPHSYTDGFIKRQRHLTDELSEEIFSAKYGALSISLNDPRYEAVQLLHLHRISKKLLNFPAPPRIINGVLIVPGIDEITQIKSSVSYRVLKSLNNYIPPKGHCVLRKIEPKWFISMCGY